MLLTAEPCCAMAPWLGWRLDLTRHRPHASVLLVQSKAQPLPHNQVGPSDEQLVAACAAGDRGALGRLFDRHHQDLYRFLSRIAGPHGRDLDDLVQTTFMAVSDAARRFSGRSTVRSWLFAIAGNLARDQARGEIRQRRLAENAAQLPMSMSAPASPEVTAEHKEALAHLAEALDRLPHDLRVTFVMCEIEETPGKDAAAALGVPEGTIWRRLFDARLALLGAAQGKRNRRGVG
jgi:RNA polymerase sigma-70 factor (ECF subfamily)